MLDWAHDLWEWLFPPRKRKPDGWEPPRLIVRLVGGPLDGKFVTVYRRNRRLIIPRMSAVSVMARYIGPDDQPAMGPHEPPIFIKEVYQDAGSRELEDGWWHCYDYIGNEGA